MTRTLHSLLPAVCLALATTTFAQTPTPPAGTPPMGQARPSGPRPAPTNLKVLPKDTTGDQIIPIMHGYTGALGVKCTFCHATNPETKRTEFASDTNPVKDKARLMIKMTQTINSQFVSKLDDPKAENPVTCGTCHRGGPQPSVFVPKPEENAPRPAPTTPPPTPKQ